MQGEEAAGAKRSRRTYTIEHKADTIRLLKREGLRGEAAAKRAGVPVKTLEKWEGQLQRAHELGLLKGDEGGGSRETPDRALVSSGG